MADTPDINHQLASATAALSTTSPTEAGRAERASAIPGLVDSINQAFALFRANYHNQYYAAFGNDQQSVSITKKLWLQSLSDFPPESICRAAEKIIAESEYLPTLHKMLDACQQVALPAGMPGARDAYREACLAASPKAVQKWSHPAVYLAGRDCGWYVLSNQPESIALKQFSEVYMDYCRRVAKGEQLVLDPASQIEEQPSPATKCGGSCNS